MPTGGICTANVGTPMPLSYGFFRATGMRLIDFTVQPTTAVPAGTFPANMQIGFWDLGEGELDGCNSLWINNNLQFAVDPQGNLMGSTLLGVIPSNTATTPTLNFFNFYTGCDAALAGQTDTSQGLSSLWNYIGPLAIPLRYSRRSYYAIGWTPATNDSSTMSPLGDFRGMRCRIFDGAGNQTGYQFTTNPVWHAVDLYLRRAVKPEYAIDQTAGPTPLTAAESSCFNWPSIYASAQYCDFVLANGQPRFSGSYVFSSGSTLEAMLEQVMLSCRGYTFEYAGQIYIKIDQPRASSFVVSAHHLAQASLAADNTQVNQAGNRYIAQFLELGLPAVATISTLSRTATQLTIDTVNPNPCATNDLICVGGVADPSFDAVYLVSATPSNTEVDCTISGGSVGTSTGGSIGYSQSRFSQRTPEISHQQHQRAQGQILPPAVTGSRLKRIKTNYDFASMTYDQANRLLKYEIYRDLGLDYLNPNLLIQLFGNASLLGSTYMPPFGLTLSLYSESVDVNGSALKAQLQGDIITVDPTASVEFAGEYEIMERYLNPFQQEVQDSTSGSFVQPTARSGGMNSGTDSNSGILKLVLRSYNPNVFFDVSDAPNSSFATVPGQLLYKGTVSSTTAAQGGTLTASTPYVMSSPIGSTVSWTAIPIEIGTSVVTISAGSENGLLVSTRYYFYVVGESAVLSTVPPSPGTGVFLLAAFNTPDPPAAGFPTNSTTISLA